ncbi:MAG: glutamate--tRNA ligase [Candidatus Andersenbacteria bacterium CG10_big_fil_rev_8_21_14_0_10_54_11]|uniref:Glutamate--tRNA ligase n=1 Tax=Candidatus Andersenbacteria bacterium CG10_big_fil_rev_8_21_14_0_10_54_11 TaxID=1974485 RepID=A0A2M6WZ39_9BACT|nr:MAG: glutamate--tRNA ligase [Candidatus Andersenbacteria bacterium CG10_big_fil_rev_8_21_14_0_10_54_11]
MATTRTRIAPSPTGNLHVGTARAALYNELFARQQGGAFIVRIEDTDQERSGAAYEANILEGLRWLGLIWDEGPDVGGGAGPYRQSERQEGYRQAIHQLLESGAAYRVEDGQAIKLRVPDQEVVFTDLIRGEVRTPSSSWGGDFVIARNEKSPVFHLAVVVDDAAQRISHVIRGEDHISNTARHILLQQALGMPSPKYAHLPLLLDEQRRKLSKRAGDVDLLAYRERGFLPAAMLNYLALLGWNSKTDREIFTHEELITAFRLTDVQKGGAIFSEQKLVSINKDYLRRLSPEELLKHAKPFLEAAGIQVTDRSYWAAALATEQERVGTLAELPEAVAFFIRDWQPKFEAPLLVWKKSDAVASAKRLDAVTAYLSDRSAAAFTVQTLEHDLLAWIDDQGLGRGDTLWPMRVALTGREHSPGPFAVAAVLGKDETLRRLRAARQLLA